MKSHKLLYGKRGLIFGVFDRQSLAWHVARQCAIEGADFVLTNTAQAMQIGDVEQLAEELNADLIQCDATDTKQLEFLVQNAQKVLAGKLDFVLHAVAQSQNLRRGKAYHELNYNYYAQTLDTSALSFHKLLQTCYQLDALADNASVVALTYIASERSIAGYNDMADAKAMLESIARNWGRIYGEKKAVRVNTVSQSPTITNATQKFYRISKFAQITDNLSPLGNATADDCAKLCVALFSDYMPKVTMQNIHNDGGYSMTALSDKFIDFWEQQTHNKD